MGVISQELLYRKRGRALQNSCKVLPYVSETISELIQRRIRELGISKSALAERVGVSRAYIGDLANGTAKTRSGFYRPKPEIVKKLAESLEVSEIEILNALGYAPQNKVLPHELAIMDYDGFKTWTFRTFWTYL